MYDLSVSAEGDCYLCVSPDPGIEAAALGASESSLPCTAPAEALHTFTLESSPSRCFSRKSTTLTPLSAPLWGAVLARSSTVLPCPAVPSRSLTGLHLPSSSTNLVSTAALQDAMVTTTTPGAQRVSICTCTRTGRHLATFTRRPGSSQYTLNTEPPHVAASAQVSASGPVAPPCSCHLLSHQTLLWHPESVTPPCHTFVACTPASLSLVFLGLFLPSRPRLPRPAFLASRGGSGDPDAPDIPTPRSYAEAITDPYSSQWQAAMDAEMASWKSTGTYVDEVPPPGANIVDRMWILRVKRPPASPPAFKMTTLRVLLHVAAQRDYELHSLDFSTAFLQGSLHDEIWLRRPSFGSSSVL
ncbi:unnamed protein product [Closterium sp. NIES-53]